jgi:RNA-directed DNA polymerase
MHRDDTLARTLAATLLRGPFEIEAMVARGAHLLGRRWRWLAPLARRVCATFADRHRPRHITLTNFLLDDRGFLSACERHELVVVDRLSLPAEMIPIAAARDWRVPAICTAGELADWLEVSVAELLWFADPHGLGAKSRGVRLRHYHPRLLAKRFGQVRLIEAPKPRLKAIQRRILDEILMHVPAHDSAHGFCCGRSSQTFAVPHVGRHVVLRLDLEDFFPSISAARVAAIFRAVGYSEHVADLLTGLATTITRDEAWDDDRLMTIDLRERERLRRLYARRHLPQGAPTSPSLANLAAYRLDCRLAALADSAGATYTRYADDLAFSGGADFARVVHRFRHHAAAIALDEGFHVHHRKSRIMRPGVRQHLAGIVVNAHPNIPRADFDRLKATLTNCARHGPDAQNRAGHREFRAQLLGRVTHVEAINPVRGRKLREVFERIAW